MRPAALTDGLLMKEGEDYNEKLRDLDYKKIMERYWAIGCIKTAIEKDQPVTDQPGFVDVVYRVSEGSPFYVGQLIYKGNAHTKEKVFRHEAGMAGLLPGEILDLNRLDKYKQRVLGTGFVVKDGQAGAIGKGLEISIRNERSGDKPYGEDVALDAGSFVPGRLQSPEEAPLATRPLPPLPAATTPPPLAPMNLGGPSLTRKKPTVVPPAVTAAALANQQTAALIATRMQSGEPELQLPGDPPALPPIEIGPGPALAAPAITPAPSDPGVTPAAGRWQWLFQPEPVWPPERGV